MFRKVLGLALILGLMGSGVAVADEPAEKCVCPVAAGMEKLPKMTYLVGTESTCCSKTAEKLAEKSGEKIQYVVAKKNYTDIGEAYTALADETEAFVNAFATPSTCKVSGTTSIAGQSLNCSEKAAKVAKVIEDAMKSVTVSYKIGDQTVSCPNQASQLAKESGKDQVFVVGEESTHCPIDARIKVAQAKYKAALQALANMAQAEEETKTVSVES